MTSPAFHRSLNGPLAIVGASARAAAAAAQRAGFQPVTADMFADADLRQFATATAIAPYPEGLLDWLRAINPPAWMYTGALENWPELVDQMAWVAPLWGNPGDVLERVRSPWELGRALRAAGLLFPETRAASDGLPLDGSWLAKTYRGASGSGVRELVETQGQGGRETGRQYESRDASSSPCLPYSLTPCFVFQQRVTGTPCAAVFVAAGGAAELLAVTQQLIAEEWLGARGFQYCGSIGPYPVPAAALAAICSIGQALAREFELVGLFGVDFVLDGDQVWTIEVNPRYTASMEIVERATGVPAIAAHARACTEGLGTGDWGLGAGDCSPASAARSLPPPASRLSPTAPGVRVHGKAILFARRDLLIAPRFAQASLRQAIETPWPKLADVPAAGALVDAGRPILTIFAHGTTTDEVEFRLRERVDDLESQIYGTGQ